MSDTSICEHPRTSGRIFCGECGKIQDKDGLRSVRLMGAVGVLNSSSDTIAEFWETGDPDVFDRP